MRKIISAFVGVMFIGGAFAAGVTERVNCADTKTRIDTLAAQEKLNDSDAALLSDLRASYRSNCMARTSGRGVRTIAASRNPSASDTATEDKDNDVATEEPVVAASCSTPDANGCCPGEEFEDMGADGKYCCKGDMCFPPMDVATVVAVSEAVVMPQKSEAEIAAEIAANIEKGLCGDGTKPNKFGCCTGEIFKDLGNTTFACCKKDTDECFPPMK